MEKVYKEAVKYFEKKEYEKSLTTLRGLEKIYPENLQILTLISINFMFLNKNLDGINYLNKIILINPNIPESYFNLGLCYSKLNNLQLAIENYSKAIKLNSYYHQAYINLGNLFKSNNLLEDAIKLYKNALTLLEKKDEIYVNLSDIYKIKKDFNESIKYAEKALNINNRNYFALNNLGISLIETGRPKEAITILKKATEINTKFAMSFANLGIAYRYDSQYDHAEASYQKAIQSDPDFYDAYFNLGQIQLLQNKFQKGWQNYEYRWYKKEKAPKKINFTKPYWNGELNGKRILIWGEQGIGEQILFTSVFKDIINNFEKILLLIDDRLCKIFRENFPNIEVYPMSESVDENLFDYHLPICSLGKYFRKESSNFLNSKHNFLNVNENKFNDKDKKFRCALSWKSANPDTGFSKSIKLEDLLPILSIKDIEFYSIQYTNEEDELKNFKDQYNIEIKNVKNLDTYNDIYGLLQFIKTCDFTLSVSNSNAHLACSIGCPTYLLLPKEVGKFWYWENKIEDKNLWYPNVKIFNQISSNEWKDPISQIKKELINHYSI